MPNFLQTTFLTGMIALAVPVLIHLFFRLKTKRVELGTIRFVRIVLEENARRRKVMQWLLLALRLAVVALLVMMFARPFLTAATTGGEATLLVILIDQSASMQVKGDEGRLIDQAVHEARQLTKRIGRKTRCEVAFFDNCVHPMSESSGMNSASGAAALESLKVPTETFGATNFGAALAWARDICLKEAAGIKELHIFTDMQRSGLDWIEVEPLPTDVAAHLHDLGRSAVNNLAVSEVRAPRLWVRPGEAPLVRATVMHGGAFALEEIPVVLEIGRVVPRGPETGTQLPAKDMGRQRTDVAQLADRFTKRERLKLEPSTSVTVDFELPPLTEGLWQGRVAVEFDDELAFDNQRFFAISATPAYRILIVDGGSAEASLEAETHYLAAALRLSAAGDAYSGSPFAPTTIGVSAAGLPDLSGYDAVCLANVNQLPKSESLRLAAFVQNGGGLLVFTGDNTTAQSTASLTEAGLAAGKIGDINVAIDLPWRFNQWDETHPIFQPLNDPQHGDLRRLIFAANTRIEPANESMVLARFNNGDPAVLERPVGAGVVLWVTTSCGREWSDWSISRLFLPLVHQMLGYEVGLTAGGRVRTRLMDDPVPADAALNPAERSARRQLIPGVDQHPRYAEVINTSPRESETERCTRQEFEERFGLTFVDGEGVAAVQRADWERKEHQPDEVWHWVGCVLLAAMLLEGFVGNRTTA